MTCIFQIMHAAYAYYLSKFTEFVDTVNFLYFGTKISSKLFCFICNHCSCLVHLRRPEKIRPRFPPSCGSPRVDAAQCLAGREVSSRRPRDFFRPRQHARPRRHVRLLLARGTGTKVSCHFLPSFYLPLLLLKF